MSAKQPSDIQPPPPLPPPQWLFKVDISHFRIKGKHQTASALFFILLFTVALPDAIFIPSWLACLSVH